VADATRTTALPRPAALLFGVLAGPVAWAVQLLVIYGATPYLCGSGWTPLLHVVSAAAFLVVALGLRTAGRSWAALGHPRETESAGAPAAGRSKAMAIGGMGASAFFLVVVVAQALPIFFLDPCRR
jgi:hypothetical protein